MTAANPQNTYPANKTYPKEVMSSRIKSVTRPELLEGEVSHRKLLIIYTGGTIGMIENPDSGALEPFDFEYLIDNVPKVKRLDFDVDSFQFEVPLDSSAMTRLIGRISLSASRLSMMIMMASWCFTAPTLWPTQRQP